MQSAIGRSRTSVLGAGVLSALVAGPLGGLLVGLLSIATSRPGELGHYDGAMLIVWGAITGFFIASVPAGVLGAGVGAYVRRRLRMGGNERGLRLRATMAGTAVGAAFGAVMPFLGEFGASMLLFAVAGGLSGSLCAAMVTGIVNRDHRLDAGRPNDELQRTKPAQAMEPSPLNSVLCRPS